MGKSDFESADFILSITAPFILNIIPDYISYYQTYILVKLSIKKKVKPVYLFLIDFLLSSFIFIISFLLFILTIIIIMIIMGEGVKIDDGSASNDLISDLLKGIYDQIFNPRGSEDYILGPRGFLPFYLTTILSTMFIWFFYCLDYVIKKIKKVDDIS